MVTMGTTATGWSKTTPGWLAKAPWTCPTCKRWVREEMSIRCAACRELDPPKRIVHAEEPEPEPVVAPEPKPQPVVTVEVKAAVAAKRTKCAVCGKCHYDDKAAYLRGQQAKGKTLTAADVAFLAQHA